MVDIPYLSVCSGIEAFSVAVSPMPEYRPSAFAEIEDFPSRVLAHRFPDVPNLGDMTAIDTTRLGLTRWLVGGTPCQSFSIAGLRKGLSDDRGNLTLEYVRLAHALAEDNGLWGFLWENVPGVLSDKSNAFGCFLGGVVGHDGPLFPGPKPGYGKSTRVWRWRSPGRYPILDDEGDETGEFEEVGEGYHSPRWPDKGMVAGPRARLTWRVLDSQHFGVAQRRRRVFVVADFAGRFDPATVLFEPRGKRRGPAPGGQEGENVAGTLGGSSQSGGFRTTDLDNNGAFVLAHTLKAEGHDASEDGTGRGVPMVTVSPTLRAGGNRTGGDRPPGSDVDTVESLVVYAGNAEGGNPDLPSLNASNGKKGINNQTGLVMSFNSKDHGQDAGELAPTLRGSGHTESHANGGAPPAVLFSITPSNSNKDFNARTNDFAQSVTTNAGGIPSARGGDIVVEAQALAMRGREGGNMPELGGDQANALRGADGGSSAPMVLATAVRRLTPEECEKLQGFPVGWTRIPGLSGWREVGDDEDVAELEAAGLEVKRTAKSNRLRVNDPDGPRYKSLGNSFTTEPVNWIMSRVLASLEGRPMPDWQPLRLWADGA